VKENRKKENGGEKKDSGNREKMMCNSEAMLNLVASALKLPSHSTGLHIIKYLVMKVTCIFFCCCSKKMYIKC